MCFELVAHIMEQIGASVSCVDETHGFRYFDERDLLGFVDGTENPAGRPAVEAALVGADDPGFAGGSYVIVQKYVHDMAAWNALTTEDQEKVIGRYKLSDIEMPGEDGYSFIRKVREMGGPDGGQIPAVALTAYGRPEDRVRSLSAGFSMHVSKPVDPVELGVIVANLAGRSPSG